MMPVSTHPAPTDSGFDVIADALFFKKKYELPGIGCLDLRELPAKYDFPQQQIIAPRPTIHFSPITEKSQLFHQCSPVSQLLADRLLSTGEVVIAGVGIFTCANGKIDFTASSIPDAFTQPVRAVKVIHKDAVHQMLVGDHETNTAAMQELLNGTATRKIVWWRAALILSCVAIAALVYYLAEYGLNALSSRSPF